MHVTAVAVEGVIEAFYDEPAAYSYFVGGSAGGRQGLMAAQRYPDDFDGLLVSAPTLNISKIQMWGLWKAQAMSGEGYVSPDQLPALAAAVYGRCDGLDGVMDGAQRQLRAAQSPGGDRVKGCFVSNRREVMDEALMRLGRRNSDAEDTATVVELTPRRARSPATSRSRLTAMALSA